MKTTVIGFRPGRKSRIKGRKAYTKLIKKAFSGNTSFILLYIPLERSVKEGIIEDKPWI